MYDHHGKPFDAETQTKLFIYRSYLQGWLQVFLISSYYKNKTIRFFDFFSGPGMDKIGQVGSPLILLEEISKVRRKIVGDHRRIEVFFNDKSRKNISELKSNCEEFDTPCEIHFYNLSFNEAYPKLCPLIGDGPSLVFLDQCGVKNVTESVFSDLASKKLTDILFFFASSYQWRFSSEFSNNISIAPDTTYKEVHRAVANAYRKWAPPDYYVGDYSILKGTNIYGLIFGTSHPKGIFKFLEVVWRDELGGDANFDMEAEKLQSDLFEPYKKTKIELVREELIDGITEQRFKTDKDVALHCCTRGILPSKVARDVYKLLKDNGVLKHNRSSQPRTGSHDVLSNPRNLIS